MTCIRLWFLNFQKWQTYVNNLSIPYRMTLVASKSVQKRAGNTWSKKYLKFMVFAPLIPLFYEFLKFLFFRNVDHVEAKRMPFEFLKSTGKNRRYQGGVLNNPPLPLIGVARSLPLIGLTIASVRPILCVFMYGVGCNPLPIRPGHQFYVVWCKNNRFGQKIVI